MGSKGDPEAKRTRPLVQLYAYSNVHSDFDVGLDRGKMIGLSQYLHISCCWEVSGSVAACKYIIHLDLVLLLYLIVWFGTSVYTCGQF